MSHLSTLVYHWEMYKLVWTTLENCWVATTKGDPLLALRPVLKRL